MFSFTIPDTQIHMSNEPVAMFYFPTKKIKFYKIKPRGSYFGMYTKEIKGVFKLDSDYVWYIGKTPVYHYYLGNVNPFNPRMVDKLNKFMKINRLLKLKHSDVKHGAKLSSLTEKEAEKLTQDTKNPVKELRVRAKQNALERLDGELAAMVGEMEKEVQSSRELLKQRYEQYNKENDTELEPTEEEEQFAIINYLRAKGLLDESEHGNFVYKISNGILSFEELVEELRESEVLRINEPLDLDAQGFLSDFAAEEPLALSNHIDDFISLPKGLKSMTSTPVKNWIPGGTIIGIMIGVMMFIALASQGTFNDLGDQLGGIKMPFLPGGAILEKLATFFFMS